MTFTVLHVLLLHFEFKIGKSTVGEIVLETCVAIMNTLQKEEMPEPILNIDWKYQIHFIQKPIFPTVLML